MFSVVVHNGAQRLSLDAIFAASVCWHATNGSTSKRVLVARPKWREAGDPAKMRSKSGIGLSRASYVVQIPTRVGLGWSARRLFLTILPVTDLARFRARRKHDP
jgi:hypothetical protein